MFATLLIGNGLTDDRVRCHKWFNYAAATWFPAILHFFSALCIMIGLIGWYIATLAKKKVTNADNFEEETYFSSYHLIQFILLIVWSSAALISPVTISYAWRDCNSTSCSSGAVNVNLSYRISVPILTILFSSILIWKQKSSHYFFSFKLAKLCIVAWALSLSLLLVETIVSISYGSDVVSQYLNFSKICENQNGSFISIADLGEEQEHYRPLVFQFCLVGLSVAITLLRKEAPNFGSKKKVILQRHRLIKIIVSFVCFALGIVLFTPLFVRCDKIWTEISMSILGIVLIIILAVFEVWDLRESPTKPSWTLTNIELHVFVLTFALGIIPVAVFSFVTNTACRELNETCNDDVPFKKELLSTVLYLIQASMQVASILFLKRHAHCVSQSRIYSVLGSAVILSSLNLTWCGTDITYWSWDESELARYLGHKGNELYTNWLFILRLAVSVAAYFRYKSFQVFLKFFVTILEEYEEPQTGRTSPVSVGRKGYKSLQETTRNY